MITGLAAIILLLCAIPYTSAEPQESTAKPGAYIDFSNHKQNNSNEQEAQKPAVHNSTQESKVSGKTLGYRHDRPTVIADPSIKREDDVQPLEMDFKKDKRQAVLEGTLMTRLVFNIHDNPLWSEVTAAGSPSNLFAANDIKAASSLQNKKYAHSPVKIEETPLKDAVGTTTEHKSLKQDKDDIKLSASPPEVIYEPGDDISFIYDLTVIDNYEHEFDLEAFNKGTLSSKTTRKPTTKTTTATAARSSTTKALNKNKKSWRSQSLPSLNVAASNDVITRTSVTHSTSTGRSAINHASEGYAYDKPAIPFTF